MIYKIALNSATTAAPTLIGGFPLAGGGESPNSIVLDLANG